LDKLNKILQFPESCLVNKKITKAFFKRNFDLTTSEKKLLDDFSTIIQIDWLASVKPDNSNIVAFSHDQSIFEEVVIISVQTSDDDFEKNKQKIADLIQKYIPYHILLCIYNNNYFILNSCDKRINQNDASKRTVEKYYFTENISISAPPEKQKAFLKSLSFSKIDKQNLKTFYEAYTSRIIALQAAEINGSFIIRKTERSKQDVQNLENISRLQSEILTLQNQAIKETQLNVQVQLNASIQAKRKEIKTLEKLITS
jgi:hypothetical protein